MEKQDGHQNTEGLRRLTLFPELRVLFGSVFNKIGVWESLWEPSVELEHLFKATS